jgi:Xaa-Pro aminopeptidase
MTLESLIHAVQQSGVDAWAMFDFRRSNAAAWTVLRLAPDAHCTRRWMVVVRADGRVFKVVHAMEQIPLQHIEAEALVYVTRSQWEHAVRQALEGCTFVGMEYSPMGALPAVSCVDAGTIELVRSFGCTVVSAADLAQQFTATLTREQIAENLITAQALRTCMMVAFDFIRSELLAHGSVTEYRVQQELLHVLAEQNLRTDSPPIVAIGPNAARPHYAPSVDSTSVILPGMVVLIDVWARGMSDDSVYADITWVGYTGETIPTEVQHRFNLLIQARDAAVEMCRQHFQNGQAVFGWQLDDACRSVIQQAGFGDWFIHRTGHNITTVVHGPGANLDNYETQDTRRILPGTSFSVEPGIYEPGVLGLRTELDVVVTHDGTVTVPSSPVQMMILPILGTGDVLPS